MTRLPRFVIPGQPQHIIQRGKNRQLSFAAEADYQFFRDALVEAATKHGLAIHAYVWMTNHIHHIELNAGMTAYFHSIGARPYLLPWCLTPFARA